ncbi:hypothetical protein POM88_013100 [Heracleum sosnowskyi]|uniref:ZC3H15/TMA46 family C-terminal domain-containing protein n=1 Tax=Heracleum sosnowskyi TaxID=360622 RepID=A0AAD8IXR1_9APIA|nr:hypothetical protein POM88_013100 [Heracleum sosnowskyi]
MLKTSSMTVNWLSEKLEKQRTKVITSTPMTPELFLEWKKKKKMEARDAAEMAERANNDCIGCLAISVKEIHLHLGLVKLLNKLASARALGLGGGSQGLTDLLDGSEETLVAVELRIKIDQNHADLNGKKGLTDLGLSWVDRLLEMHVKVLLLPRI